jgi:hypothetical protein
VGRDSDAGERVGDGCANVLERAKRAMRLQARAAGPAAVGFCSPLRESGLGDQEQGGDLTAG